jgi:predicted RNA-binding Zn ribbon-like protein
LKGIEKVKSGLKAVESLPKRPATNDDSLKKRRLRAINLAAVEVWEICNREGEKIENDNATGVLGHAVGFVDHLLRDDVKTIHDDRAEKWALERELVAEIKKTIVSGEADRLREALHLIRHDGPDHLREAAKNFLEEKSKHGHSKGSPLWELVDYAARPDKRTETAHDLLERAFELEYDANAVETPFAVYSLVHAVSADPKVRSKAEEGMKALAGESGFGRAAMKFVFSSSPEGAAVDVGLMFLSAGLGNLAKLSALAKLEKAGVTGYKAVVLGKAAEIGAETTALWALNTGKEALTHDVGVALDPEHLAKSLAATGLMIGFLKVFGAAGGEIAKRLGLKKASGFALGHGSGLAGMIASTKAGEALDLHDAPPGGSNESLVHDVFGYVKFALAHKAVDSFLGGKLSEIGHRLHAKTAVVEAKIKVREAIDDLLATSPRVSDKVRETIRRELLAEALRTGRIPDRVEDVLPRILEALKAPGTKRPLVTEKSESGATIELRDEDIRTSDTEVLPIAARRAVTMAERPISLGAYRKGVPPASKTFHAARVVRDAIHAKIRKGVLGASDPAVRKELEKCEAVLEKYETMKPVPAPL